MRTSTAFSGAPSALVTRPVTVAGSCAGSPAGINAAAMQVARNNQRSFLIETSSVDYVGRLGSDAGLRGRAPARFAAGPGGPGWASLPASGQSKRRLSDRRLP